MAETITLASNFAPPEHNCPTCGALSKRHSVRDRRVKDINLDRRTVIKIRVGVYRCQPCQKFFSFQPPFVEKWKHYGKRAMEKARVAVSEDKTTFWGLKRRLERDFHISPAVSTAYSWFHDAADQIDLARDYEPWAAAESCACGASGLSPWARRTLLT